MTEVAVECNDASTGMPGYVGDGNSYLMTAMLCGDGDVVA